jgi:hypothetical protein
MVWLSRLVRVRVAAGQAGKGPAIAVEEARWPVWPTPLAEHCCWNFIDASPVAVQFKHCCRVARLGRKASTDGKL